MGWQDRRYDGRGGGAGWSRALRRVFVDGDNFYTWGIPLFRLWGIEVRLHLLFVLYMVIELFQSFDPANVGPMFKLLAMGSLFGIVLIHEFGHCLACRYVGGSADQIVLWPLGGLAMCHPPRNWKANLITTLGGPAVHIPIGIVLAGVLLGLGAPTGVVVFSPFESIGSVFKVNLEFFQGELYYVKFLLWRAYVINGALFLFNMLLVMFPMDAGRVVQALMWRKMGYRKSMLMASNIGIGMAIAVGIYAYSWPPVDHILVMIAFFAGFECVKQRRYIAMMGSEGVWEEAAEAAREESDRKYQAALRKQREQQVEQTQHELEINRILDKIASGGMGSLSRKERAVLEKETQRKREAEARRYSA